MKLNRKLLVILLTGFLIGATMYIGGCKKQPVADNDASTSAASEIESQEKKMAPEFVLSSYDGKSVRLSDYRGKIVVLEWFNYECPFLVYHYEPKNTMIDLADKYGSGDVVWLAINSTAHQTTEKNREFAQKHGIGYPILDDRTGQTGRAYQAVTTPHMFIINTQGYIVYDGAIDNSPMGREDNIVNYVDQALGELISAKPISVSSTKPYGCTVKYAD